MENLPTPQRKLETLLARFNSRRAEFVEAPINTDVENYAREEMDIAAFDLAVFINSHRHLIEVHEESPIHD